MKEPEWLEERTILAFHSEQIAEHGGKDGLRDIGMLRSALARPQNVFAYVATEPTLARLAAEYAFGIARNHPFADGNKRTAYLAARAFLLLNGADLNATKEDKYRVIYSLAEGTLSLENLIDWFEKHTVVY